MTKRVNTIGKLGAYIASAIMAVGPAEATYDLGSGSERTEALITHIDEDDNRYSARVDLSPLIKINGNNMEVTDSNGADLRNIDDSTGNSVRIADSYGTVQSPFRDLIVNSTAIENPGHAYELETLVSNLEGGTLAIAPYSRPE